MAMTSPAATDPVLVRTAAGQVRGGVADDLRVWRGIPYAAPPAGPLRFRPPQPEPRWDGVRTAVQPGPVAWQADPVNPFTGARAELNRDEDCLYVNVTAPARPAPDPRGYPVLVWVDGGGYVQGSGAGDLVGDATGMARRGLVAVTFNYRLGSLGFLRLGAAAGPEFAASGQAGFLDQAAALGWVRTNIAAFGGDPGRVCAYGVSAGAKSIANLLASPLAAGLIGRAISASGGGEHVATADQADDVRRRLLAELGLTDDTAGRLHDVPAPDLIAAQESLAPGAAGTWVWRPVLGAPRHPGAAGAGHHGRGRGGHPAADRQQRQRGQHLPADGQLGRRSGAAGTGRPVRAGDGGCRSRSSRPSTARRPAAASLWSAPAISGSQ
jgi:para-nitrobenzyl esterase